MKLYTVTAPGHPKKWLGSQADCAAHRKVLVSNNHVPRSAIGTNEVEVPTKKEDLLEWLNKQEL